MPEYIPHAPAITSAAEDERTPGHSGGSVGKAGVWFFTLATLLLLGLSGVIAWRWVDANLLHWGIDDGPTTTVDQVELLRRVQAFELATVKHTYAAEAHVDAGKVLNAGPRRITLPGFIAGQELDVKGRATVTAGVDLSRVRPEDMEVVREGRDTRVIVRLPPPEVLSTELEPGTLDISTSSGVVDRLRRSVGLDDKDLRDRAADEVALAAREAAYREGILDDAARETERRLQAFLQSLPQTGNGRTLYEVHTRPAPVQQ